MEKLINLLKSFRLQVSIPAAYLVHIGAKLAHIETNWWLVVETFFIAGLTMMHNDFVDRRHDRKKGKTFVFLNPNLFFLCLLIGWFCVVYAAFFFFEKQFWFLVCIITAAIGYSWMRRIFLLPLVTVTLLSASPVILGAYNALSRDVWIFFAVVFFGVLGREICKDIEDKDVDVGYKKTLLSVGIVNPEKACVLAAVCISIGLILSLWFIPKVVIPNSIFAAFAMCMFTSVFILIRYKHPTKGKQWFDLATALLLIALSI